MTQKRQVSDMATTAEIAAATAEMRTAIETHGAPVWYVNISISQQALVPLDVRRRLGESERLLAQGQTRRTRSTASVG